MTTQPLALGARLAAILVACLVVAACGGGTPSSSSTGSPGEHSPASDPTGGGRATDATIDARPTPPPFTLFVSNQSFEDPNVQITIAIDGVVVVDQNFAVEGQHNWITFEPDVSPGDHTLTARSSTGAELTVEFTTEPGQPRWAVVDYWWYPDEGPRAFTFDISDEPMAFA